MALRQLVIALAVLVMSFTIITVIVIIVDLFASICHLHESECFEGRRQVLILKYQPGYYSGC